MTASLITALQNACTTVLTDPSKIERYNKGFRYGGGRPLAAVVPETLVEMWQIAQVCAAHDVILIAQAANTGITGGSTPYGEYERPVIIMSVMKLKGIRLIEGGRQAISLPGSTLFELEDALLPLNREAHSVIGSSCIGASVIGGICNNSGGALIQRGPAYTELALYARLDENQQWQLINELGIDLPADPVEALKQLQNHSYPESAIRPSEKAASDHGYHDRVRDIDADTPARFNNDGRRLFGASGSAGKLLVFAVRTDTFEKPAAEQVFYIGTNQPANLTAIRRHILREMDSLPISGEYLHRDYFDLTEKYGRDTYRLIHHFGSASIPKFFALKAFTDRLARKIPLLPNNLSDRVSQFICNLLPRHLPAVMMDYRNRFEHHLILKMSGSAIAETQAYLTEFFAGHEGAFHLCTKAEGDAAILHRFAAAGASGRYHSLYGKDHGELMSLDIALRRNETDWFERLPAEIDAQIEKKLYCGHFFCHVMHQDYILKKHADPEALKHALLAYLDSKGAEYPAEHNVGHLYKAKEELAAFYRQNDPTNRLNPGIGKTSRKKHWA